MRLADVWLVVGTRPEAIKLAPVARALGECGLAPRLILTGQHPRLSAADYGFSDLACEDLACPGEVDPYAHADAVAAKLGPRLAAGPDLLIVQGDTSSAFGAAMAAVAAGIAVAHVEAGLRTHDPRSPWPEEAFRCAIDARAALLFAPTAVSASNLRAEGVSGAIHVTGNSGIDALRATIRELPPPVLREQASPSLLVTCHRREAWGAGLAAIAAALRGIAQRRPVEIAVVLPPNPAVTTTLRTELGKTPGLTLLEPLRHAALVERMRASYLILSDSGGIQEEAPALGVPLLVLRDKTERPEAIASGNARLVGLDPDRIIAAVVQLLDQPAALAAMSRRAFPFGDGRSGERIAAIIGQWLHHRQIARRAG